jgi:hypothetical protein
MQFIQIIDSLIANHGPLHGPEPPQCSTSRSSAATECLLNMRLPGTTGPWRSLPGLQSRSNPNPPLLESRSRELRIDPEHSFQAGQPRQLRGSVAPAAVHTESYWLAALNPATWFENLSFPEAPTLVTALVTLSPAAVSSFNLAPEVSRIFGEIGITLEIEMTND